MDEASSKVVDAHVARLRAELLRERAAKLPKATRAVLGAVRDRVLALGFELRGSTSRVPLERQLLDVIASGAEIPLSSVGAFVRGASPKEARDVARGLVKRGEARILLRGTTQLLVSKDVGVLDAGDVRKLSKELAALAARFALVARSKGAIAIAREDVSRELDQLATSSYQRMPTLLAPRAPRVTALGLGDLERVIDAVRQSVDAARGQSFVPAVVALLEPQLRRESVHRNLISAGQTGALVLKAQRGLGALSEAEWTACPEAPDGSRYVWVRLGAEPQRAKARVSSPPSSRPASSSRPTSKPRSAASVAAAKRISRF
ncbi:MAG: hypothetical protein U0414_29555 [Polyangiaceae bacterium]